MPTYEELIKQGAKPLSETPTYEELIGAGATPIKVVTSEPTQEKRGFIGNIVEGAKGFVKGAIRSATNIGKLAVAVSPPGMKPMMQATVGKTSEEAWQQAQPANAPQKIGGYIETAAEIAAPFVGGITKGSAIGQSLIGKAMRLYQSALKPSTALSPLERTRVLRTGLEEGINLTKGGIEKAAGLIDNLESQLGKAIDEAAGIIRDVGGKIISKVKETPTIKTTTLKPFVDEAKKFLGNLTDVKYSEKAIKSIDAVYENFIKKYGKEIPVDIAQTIKTSTYRWLKNYYEKLAAPTIEASKQLARGLKEGVVEIAPKAGEVNARLKELYSFEDALDKASGRLGNLNLISLGGKVLMGGNKASVIAGIVSELAGGAGMKSVGARGLYNVGKMLEKLTPDRLGKFKEILSTLGKTGLKIDLVNILSEMGLTGDSTQAPQSTSLPPSQAE